MGQSGCGKEARNRGALIPEEVQRNGGRGRAGGTSISSSEPSSSLDNGGASLKEFPPGEGVTWYGYERRSDVDTAYAARGASDPPVAE